MNKNVSDQVVYQAGNETTDTIKNMDIDDEKSYKDFVDMYKGVVDMKCLQDYGTLDDKNLWQDCAEELYLKSREYLPTQNQKAKQELSDLDKKTESKQLLTHDQLVETINKKLAESLDDKYYLILYSKINGQFVPDVFITTNTGSGYSIADDKESAPTYIKDAADILVKEFNDGYEGPEEERTFKLCAVPVEEVDKLQFTENRKIESEAVDAQDTVYNFKTIEDVENFVNSLEDSDAKLLLQQIIENEKNTGEEPKIGYLTLVIKLALNNGDLNKSSKKESTDKEYIATYKMPNGTFFELYKDKDGNLFDQNGITVDNNELKNCEKVEKKIESEDSEYDYMMLGRLKSDCDYFLGNGNGYEKHLWAGDINSQIAKMKELYNKVPEKPEWLTMDDINNYEKEMKEVLKMKSKTESYKDTEVTVGNIKELAHRLLNPEDIDTYKSDLYLKVSEKSTELINKLKTKNSGLLSKFRSPKDGNMWYDIPFANMQEYFNTKNIKESTSIISGELKVGDKFKGRIDGSIFEITGIDTNKQKVTYKVNDKTFTTGINHFKHTLLDRIEDKPLVTESKIDNYTLSEIRKVINSEGNDFTIKIINENVDVETKYLDIDKEDLRKIYIALAGNDNDLIKLPSEENSEDTRNFIQGQLDKSYDKKYESRPDKDAARSRMFSNSRKKLNMPDKFSSLDEIVSYLEKCDDQIDVMNVNTHVAGFSRQLHDDMLSFADKFIKANGYIDSYIDKNGNEQEGSFNKFKQEMINFVKNYKIQPKLQEDQYENERRKGRPNVKKIAQDEYYDNQDWYIQHIKDYKDEADFVEREKAEIASEYNLTETRSEMVCKEIYKLAKENKSI